jgi:hypothetical protein
MRVARHTSVTSIANSVHDTNFANASTALQVDSGANDLATNITLQRLDSFTFSGGGSTDVVDTSTEYAATRDNSSQSYVTIVNTLNWCTGLVGSWGGCADVGAANGLLVIRSLAISSQGGIVYAHEFGHSTGLTHDNTGNQIMDPDVLTVNDNRCRTTAICNSFRRIFQANCAPLGGFIAKAICSPTIGSLVAQEALSQASSALALNAADNFAEGSDFSGVPIEELALNFIVDHIPHEAEFFYGQDDVAVLSAMLEEAADTPFNRTIVTLIGLTSDGTNEDVFAIQDYLGRKDAEVSAAMIALGYLVNRTGSDIALDVLLGALSDKSSRFSNASALGLAVSGDATALAALQDRSRGERDPAILGKLQSAIQENKRMAALGLHEYYRQPPQTPPKGPGGGEAKAE